MLEGRPIVIFRFSGLVGAFGGGGSTTTGSYADLWAFVSSKRIAGVSDILFIGFWGDILGI
jgi:hypothetical protein